MEETRVVVLFGGASSEHPISCISAASIIDALRAERFEVIPVAISPAGRWCAFEGPTSALRVQSGVLPLIECDSADVSVVLDWSDPGIVVRGVRMHVDAAFPVLHGPWGEDGTVQGLLEMAGIPFVGSGVLASAAAMDKITMKRLLRDAGMPMTPWIPIFPGERADIDSLTFPVFVKPSRAGSSRGITRVTEPQDVQAAIDYARSFDPRVIVEQAVDGAREIECGVRVAVGGDVVTSRCSEIIVDPAHDFYDFDAKYIDSGVELKVPAELAPDVEATIREMARCAFLALGCAGLARVDFFITPAGDILINELNTIPGFTPISMFPRMWEASGVSYPELTRDLVLRAIAEGTGLR